MPAIKDTLVVRDTINRLAKRESNWAAQEPGVIVVFCIVFLVAVGLLSVWISKKIAARKAAKQTL